MGGVSKYLICGHRSTQQAVQNLFQSVQLNINNPNFLIMQGALLPAATRTSEMNFAQARSPKCSI